MSGNERKKPTLQGTSALEWAVACMGALILIATVGYLVFYGLTKQEGPPKITLASGQIEKTGSGYVVEFTASNEGNSTASALEISGRLLQGDSVVEESRATIDHVPELSLRRGGLFFSRNPALFTFQLRAEGYSSP